MIRRSLFLLVACVSLCFAADISGKWDFSVDIGGNSGSPAFEFQQNGESLTGTYRGLLGQAKVSGTVKADTIDFKFSGELNGEKIDVRYTGKIESDKKMKGTLTLGSLGEGTWTATRK
jgi:autotransporter translocation and assembly factor TamB